MRSRSGLGLALVAACMFVLQSVIGACTLERVPGFPQLDIFGNPLCIGAENSKSGDRDGGRSHATDYCCLLGCDMPSNLLAGSSDTGWLLRIHVSTGARLFPPPRAGPRDHDPGYPRAPPLLIA